MATVTTSWMRPRRHFAVEKARPPVYHLDPPARPRSPHPPTACCCNNLCSHVKYRTRRHPYVNGDAAGTCSAALCTHASLQPCRGWRAVLHAPRGANHAALTTFRMESSPVASPVLLWRRAKTHRAPIADLSSFASGLADTRRHVSGDVCYDVTWSLHVTSMMHGDGWMRHQVMRSYHVQVQDDA